MRNNNIPTAAMAMALLASSSVALAEGPAFNCARASSTVEKTICGSELLSKLDLALSKNYQSMMAVSGDLPGGAQDLRSEQKAWIAKRNKCTSEKCLVDAYRARIDDVCDVPMIKGAHPDCIIADDVK